MNDINQWMVARKFAKNEFAARHIFNGLRLFETPRFWERVHRVVLYRDWRNSKAFDKADTRSCYEKAIAGERVPKLNLDFMIASQDVLAKDWNRPKEDTAWGYLDTQNQQ